MQNATPVAVLPGACSTERLVLALVHQPQEGSRLVLRQESWCASLGWCVQKSIEMTPEQVCALRAALGTVPDRPQALARALHNSSEPEPVTIPFPGNNWQAETA